MNDGMKIYIGRNVLVVVKGLEQSKDYFYNGIVRDVSETHLFLLDKKTDSLMAFALDSIRSIQPRKEDEYNEWRI